MGLVQLPRVKWKLNEGAFGRISKALAALVMRLLLVLGGVTAHVWMAMGYGCVTSWWSQLCNYGEAENIQANVHWTGQFSG